MGTRGAYTARRSAAGRLGRLAEDFLGLATVGAALLALPVILGVRHWLIDNVASFALHMLVGLLALAALAFARRRTSSAAVAAFAGCAMSIHVLPHVGTAEARAAGSAVTWLVANVHTANVHHDALIELILDRRPEIVGLVETDSRWIRALDLPLRTYEHRVSIPRSDNFGMALYSRLPLTDARERTLGVVPTITAAVAVGRRKLDLVLVHVLPPISPEYARHRDAQLRRIAQMRPQPGGALVLAGDFNVTPYSPMFREAFASGFIRAGGLAGTFPAGLPAALRIPIDHALAAGEVSIRRTIERDIGSDHLPFTVQISAQP